MIGSYNKKMKYLLLFICFFSQSSLAQIKPVLKCLGQEEATYHKNKISGALLNLNKKMISELIQMSRTLELKKKYRSIICHHEIFPPSVALLYVVLHDQEKAFAIKTHPDDVIEISKDEKTIEEVIAKSIDSFFSFIDDLQMQASEPDCVLAKIPALKNIYLKTRYTLEDVGPKAILNEIENLEQIMKSLLKKDLLMNCPKKRP